MCKIFALEVVGRHVVDVYEVPNNGFGRFGYPEFGEFVHFFVAKDAYVGLCFKEWGGMWVLCDWPENGLKKKMVGVVYVCRGEVFVISKKEKRD